MCRHQSCRHLVIAKVCRLVFQCLFDYGGVPFQFPLPIPLLRAPTLAGHLLSPLPLSFGRALLLARTVDAREGSGSERASERRSRESEWSGHIFDGFSCRIGHVAAAW